MHFVSHACVTRIDARDFMNKISYFCITHLKAILILILNSLKENIVISENEIENRKKDTFQQKNYLLN